MTSKEIITESRIGKSPSVVTDWSLFNVGLSAGYFMVAYTLSVCWSV